MPTRGRHVFKTFRDLELEVLGPLNTMHSGCFPSERENPRCRYYLNYTVNYAHLKCAGQDRNGKQCLFRYWFKFKTYPNSNCEDGIGHFDFELFRLINSNHSLPLH